MNKTANILPGNLWGVFMKSCSWNRVVHVVILIYACVSSQCLSSQLHTIFSPCQQRLENVCWNNQCKFISFASSKGWGASLRNTKQMLLYMLMNVWFELISTVLLTDSMRQRLLSDSSFFTGRELFTGEWITASLVLQYIVISLHRIEEHSRSYRCSHMLSVCHHQWKTHINWSRCDSPHDQIRLAENRASNSWDGVKTNLLKFNFLYYCYISTEKDPQFMCLIIAVYSGQTCTVLFSFYWVSKELEKTAYGELICKNRQLSF